MSKRSIEIIGGGLAGLGLGIRLAQVGVSSRITEAGHYPRHKVCGEFISGRGVKLLKDMSLYDRFIDEGAVLARTCRFYGTSSATRLMPLSEPALCFSRYRMDELMAERYQELNGKLVLDHPYPTGKNETRAEIVYATGRRPQMNRRLAYVGYKFHLENVELEADLEMHFGEDGYVGLCRVEDGRVNVCGLAKATAETKHLRAGWQEMFTKTLNQNRRPLFKKLNLLEKTLTFTSALSYPWLPWIPSRHQETLSIGDCFASIPPLTGNGMSMALESSDLTATWIQRYVSGALSWRSTVAAAANDLNDRFWLRQLCAGPVQKFFMASWPNFLRASAISLAPWYQAALFRVTR